MIDIEHERVIPLREVPKHVPSRCVGKRLSPATVWRWAERKNNPLETIQIGGGRYTSVEAIARFVRIPGASVPPVPTAPVPTRTQKSPHRAASAGEQLMALISPGRHGRRGRATAGAA